MQFLLDELKSHLSQDERFVSDGKLFKNKVVESALHLEPALLKLLLSNPALKEHFFQDIDGILVFDKVKFQKFVSNKAFLPDSFTSFKNKIGLTSIEDNEFLAESKEIVLSWPYKDCVLEGGQMKEDAKHNEVFHNEILAPDEIDRLLEPKALTGFKKYDADGEHDVQEISIQDNFIIKGNNLLALHTLKKVYAGKVKLIYIDPPYNTGNDSFGYNDSFNHSTWLTFMRNRLEMCKTLLKSNGSIWISIGDDEVHYLKVLLDEIIPNGFIANILWQKRTSPDARKPLGDAHEHILVYGLDSKLVRSQIKPIPLTDEQKGSFRNPDNDPKGAWVSTDFTASGYRPNQMYKITTPSGAIYEPPPRKCWSKIEREFIKLKDEGRMWFGRNGDAMPRRKTYLSESEGITSWTWWENQYVGHNQEAKQESVALFGDRQPFSTPKPERLLNRIIELCTDENDIVLDFFAGSGTTAAVCAKKKRRYIISDQMTYDIDYSPERLKKVIAGEQGGISEEVNWKGGGSFIYCELAKANENFAEMIQNAETPELLKEVWREMQERAFLSYKVHPKQIDDRVTEFEALSFEDQKEFLKAVLDKNMLYVPYSEIDDITYGIDENTKALNRRFFGMK
ncbi:MAG: site-specific DNA-methyltransferase [Bacteroidota bacterium]